MFHFEAFVCFKNALSKDVERREMERTNIKYKRLMINQTVRKTADDEVDNSFKF